MTARLRAIRLRHFMPVAMLALVGCEDCWDTQVEPPAPVAHYLGVMPNAVDVYLTSTTQEATVNLVAIVYDKYSRVMGGEPVLFSFADNTLPFTLTALNTANDTTKLTVKTVASSVDRATTVIVSHVASGLQVEVPVAVHYAKVPPSGVGADPGVSPWPMVGLASGESTGWQRNLMHAFVRRTGFDTFVPSTSNLPPVGDEPSGTVLSSKYVLWRKKNPWTATPNDVTVPSAGSTPAQIPLRPVFVGSNFATQKLEFQSALEGGADIIDNTLTGATGEVEGLIDAGKTITWSKDCGVLGTQLAMLAPNEQPGAAWLAVYMVKRSGVPGEDTGLHCGPGTMGTVLQQVHAIFLPEGPVLPSTTAHEIGHALSLTHVTNGSDFFDDNLMVETDESSAKLRSHFTVGQAFRAALDPTSWLVLSGAAKSASITCSTEPLKCPLKILDALVRTP